LVQLERDALQRAVLTAEQNVAIQEANLAELARDALEGDVASAQAAVDSTHVHLEDLLAGPSDVEWADAEAALTSAEAQLEDVLAGSSAAELARAEMALASARTTAEVEAARYAAMEDQILVARQQLALAEVDLKSARYFYDALKNDWQHKDYADFSPEAETLKGAQTAYDVAAARYDLNVANLNDSALRAAQAQVAQAEADLATLTEEQTVQIATAREQVALAEANLALIDADAAQIAAARAQWVQAETNLANLLQGASPEKVAIAEIQVEQAKIQLADVRDKLEEATLRAPFDGIVTAVHVDVGESSNGVIVEMVDPDSLQVVLDVDEVDIGSIALGQQTRITLETWPDRELNGQVVAVAPKSTMTSPLTSYEVHIDLDLDAVPVRSGMTANADLITASREDALLVPNDAIVADRAAGAYYVYRFDGQDVVKTEVRIGLRDGRYTEITSGLVEGDELAIGYGERG
jgi:multidrug efflux pump subunit AcrA (membrane-fusion protein)